MPEPAIPSTPCATCQAPIFLATNTRNAAAMPFDAAPAADGAFVIRQNFGGRLIAEPLTVAQRFGRGLLYKPHGNNCRRRPPTTAPHAFERDTTVPGDFHGRAWCLCGLPGEAGDDRHPLGALPLTTRRYPPTPAAAQELDDRRMGEVIR